MIKELKRRIRVQLFFTAAAVMTAVTFIIDKFRIRQEAEKE